MPVLTPAPLLPAYSRRTPGFRGAGVLANGIEAQFQAVKDPSEPAVIEAMRASEPKLSCSVQVQEASWRDPRRAKQAAAFLTFSFAGSVSHQVQTRSRDVRTEASKRPLAASSCTWQYWQPLWEGSIHWVLRRRSCMTSNCVSTQTVRLSILPVIPSVRPSVRPSVPHLYIRPSVCLSVSSHPPTYLPTYLPGTPYQPTYVPVYLPTS
jgi:hypothetical protein